MKLVAAYLLACLGGNGDPSADDLMSILASVGAEAEKEMVHLLLKEVNGKDLAELMAAGREKFACVPSGGAVAAAPVASSDTGADAAAAPAAEEAKKEEKVEEESDEEMCFSLFD